MKKIAWVTYFKYIFTILIIFWGFFWKLPCEIPVAHRPGHHQVLKGYHKLDEPEKRQ